MANTKSAQIDAPHPVKPKRSRSAYLWSVSDLGSAFNPKTLTQDTWDKPSEEREFLNRLDACLLSCAFLSYLAK